MQTQLLASGFGSPWMLAGLLLAAIPIMIHLFHRRQYQETHWAAMRFLIAATRRNSRRIRLEQLVLLAVRILILVLATLALAQPYVETWSAQYQPDEPAHWLLVLDVSYSMGAEAAEGNSFRRGVEMARQLVESAKQGDAFHLIRLCGSPPRVVVRQASYRKDEVLRELEQLALTEDRGEVLPSLQDVLELLEQVPEISRKEVCLLSDFQANCWRPDDATARSLIVDTLERIADRSHLLVLDIGQERTVNATVSDLSCNQEFLLSRKPIVVRARVENTGQAPLQSSAVNLLVDGQHVRTTQVTLAPGEATPVEFQCTLESPGTHRIEVQLSPDSLNLDNRAYLAVWAADEVRVLLVDGRRLSLSTDQGSFYIRQALDPPSAGEVRPERIVTSVCTDGELLEFNLSEFDCVFLCDVELFTRPEADALQLYAENGGGIVFVLGGNVSPLAYNEVLFRNGQGVLPGRIAGRMGSATDPQQLFHFAPGNLEHPILDAYRGNPGTGLERPLTLEYFRVEVDRKNSAEVVLPFDSGDPAILEKPVGRGRCVLLTTPCDSSRWNTLPRRDGGILVALMHEIVHFAILGKSSMPQLLVGDALARKVPRTAADAPVTITRPDGGQDKLTVQVSKVAGVIYNNTDASGFYEVEIGSPLNEQQTFAVNLDTVESQLVSLPADSADTQLLQGIQYRYQTNLEGLQGSINDDALEQRGLTRWFLYAAMILLCIELLMAWRFYPGLLCLYVVVIAVLVVQTMAFSALWAISLATLALIGFGMFAFFCRGQLAWVRWSKPKP